jgi:P27 family predicted phage terminase small subunit
MEEYVIDDQAGQLILETALQAFDRMRECQEQIKADGLVSRDKNGNPKQHPLVPVERDSRSAMLNSLKQLNLDLEPLKNGPGRPGGRKNYGH